MGNHNIIRDKVASWSVNVTDRIKYFCVTWNFVVLQSITQLIAQALVFHIDRTRRQWAGRKQRHTQVRCLKFQSKQEEVLTTTEIRWHPLQPILTQICSFKIYSISCNSCYRCHTYGQKARHCGKQMKNIVFLHKMLCFMDSCMVTRNIQTTVLPLYPGSTCTDWLEFPVWMSSLTKQLNRTKQLICRDSFHWSTFNLGVLPPCLEIPTIGYFIFIVCIGMRLGLLHPYKRASLPGLPWDFLKIMLMALSCRSHDWVLPQPFHWNG